MRATRQQKKSVVKLGFQMFYHPIVALQAYMGGYMLRKTFVETSFRMNALIKLQPKHVKFHRR